MDAITTYHLFRTYDVERGTGNARNKRPGYAWRAGYAQATATGGVTTAMTMNEWRLAANADGAKLKFHKTEDAAKTAAKDNRK